MRCSYMWLSLLLRCDGLSVWLTENGGGSVHVSVGHILFEGLSWFW